MSKSIFIALSLSLTACNRFMPLPIGGTAVLHPQTYSALAAPLQGPQLVIGAGQSNMAYNDIKFTFAPYCRLPVTVSNIAVGGTLLDQWDRGGQYNQGLINALKQDNVNVLLWWQGEADAGDITYGARFSDFLDNVRSDCGKPTLIIIYVQLGNSLGRKEWDLAKSQQASIHKPNTYLIKSEDIKQDSDGLHYLTTGGYAVMGQRLAQEFNLL